MHDAAAAVRLIAQALERRPSEIPSDGTIETVPGWDSLGHVKILLLLETELERLLAPAEVATIRSVPDIERILSSAAPQEPP
jgi:acyl carrier protein